MMTLEKWSSLLVAAAALMGAAGMMEAAYAAHGSPDPLLQTSSHFLVLHAAAAIAIASFAVSSPSKPRTVALAGAVLLLGTLVFCADLSLRGISGSKLFPMAAPLGGTLMILGWSGAAIAALFTLRKRSED